MKFLRWLLLLPVALFEILIAIANRQSVTFSLDPFNPLEPAIGVTMPLALIVIIAIFFGILIGGFASWRQSRLKAHARSTPVLPAAQTLPVADAQKRFT